MLTIDVPGISIVNRNVKTSNQFPKK